MEPYQIDNLLEIFEAVLLIGTSTGAIAALMYTWSRVRGAGSKQVAKLAESMETIQHMLEDMRGEQEGHRREMRDRIDEISGRVEFAERLLTKARSED